MSRTIILTLLCLVLGNHVMALELRSAHTFQLSDGESAPQISLDDLHWIVGNWTGTIFGEQFEEVWNPPSAGSMVGMFKVLDNSVVSFYELQLITQDIDGITLKVKHFNPDFSAWEEKADYASFRFIGMEENAIHFSGLSFYRLSADTLEAYILLRFDEEVREEKITYQRR